MTSKQTQDLLIAIVLIGIIVWLIIDILSQRAQ